MGLKSIYVPQPEFSNWVIKKRQELNLSPSCLREKVAGKLSERTLKYLEDGKKNSFSEYTLNILAQGLELSYPDLLAVIRQLNSKSSPNKFKLKKFFTSKIILFFISALLVFLIFFFLIGKRGIVLKNANRLADVEIHSQYPQVIIAFDGKGNHLWQKNIKNSVKKVAKSDLDGDGHIEVIAATWKQNSEDMGKRPGWLLVWNENGDLITELNLWKPSIYPAQEPRACVADIKIIDLENDGTLEMVVAVRGEQYYPSRIAVLHFKDSKFEEVKSYWNPGYVLKLFIEDVDDDNIPEIVCICVNNDFKRVVEFGLDDNVYSIFMLKGTEIYGQAPPYLGDEQIGSEVWYCYVTPPSSNENSKIMDVTFMGEDEKLIYVKLKDSCFFYLNYSGDIVDTFEGDHCRGETQLHLIPKERIWK
jgi:hypothetical protein